MQAVKKTPSLKSSRPSRSTRPSRRLDRPHSVTASPVDTPEPIDFELVREIELVIRNRSGRIIHRTGIFVSALESEKMQEGCGIDFFFRVDLTPGENVGTPDGHFWNETDRTWYPNKAKNVD